MKMDVFDNEERILRIYGLEGKIMWSTFNEIQNIKCPMDITISDINDINIITYQCHRTLLFITLVHIQSTAAIKNVKDKNTYDGHLLLPPK